VAVALCPCPTAELWLVLACLPCCASCQAQCSGVHLGCQPHAPLSNIPRPFIFADDFRFVSLIPTQAELDTSAPNASTDHLPVLACRRYESAADLLSTNFLLLREDATAALRQAIWAFRAGEGPKAVNDHAR